METLFDDPLSMEWMEKYRILSVNKEGIERKLKRDDLPPEKRKGLEFHLRNLNAAITRHMNQDIPFEI